MRRVHARGASRWGSPSLAGLSAITVRSVCLRWLRFLWHALSLPQRIDRHDHLQMSRVALGTTVNVLPGEAVHHPCNGFRGAGYWRWLIQQVSARRKLRCATAIAQDAVVPNAHEALGQDVQEEASNEFRRF
jgi:hypothetical protein